VSNQDVAFTQKLNTIFKKSLPNLAIVGLGLVLVAQVVVVQSFLSQMDPKLLNQCPYYQLYHFSEHGLIFFSMFSITLAYYLKNTGMRKAVFREIRDFIATLSERFHY
jgi:hypothetical protein